MWRFAVHLPQPSFQVSCTTRAFSSSLFRLKRSSNHYNPANPQPLYIRNNAKGHIEPKKVEMKSGYGCCLCRNGLESFGYKDVLVLHQFITPEGYLINKRNSGVCQKMQRKLAKSIKHARNMGYLPRKPQTLMNQST